MSGERDQRIYELILVEELPQIHGIVVYAGA